MRWPRKQVPHQRFPADEKFIGHHVPRPDQDAAAGDRRAQPRFLLGTDLEIVLEDNRLPVEVKVLVRGVAIEQIEEPIDQRHQPEAELFVGEVPLAVPVRVRNDVDVEHAACAPLAVSP